MSKPETSFLDVAQRKFEFKDEVNYIHEFPKGLSKEVVEKISKIKDEPEWMLNFRLKAFEHFMKTPLPKWGGDLTNMDFNKITYYIAPTDKVANSWDDVPEGIRKTFERLGIPEAERKFLAGAGAMYESTTAYHKLREDLEKKGVIFCDMDTAVKKYPEIVKKYFGTVIPIEDNKFASLNSAVWSGGSFVYIPKNVKVDLPLQAYFRINAESIGQFERTLIIIDEGAEVHYIEGCSAPRYSTNSLHAAVVEIIAMKNARVRYTTLQNWSGNVYNLVTKRAYAYEGAYVEWLDANVGAKLTMKYPSVYLLGEGAKTNILSIAFANNNQHQDTGSKVYHLAPNTSSTILSKSVSKGNGKTTFRGLIKIAKGSTGSKAHMRCDALMLDKDSKSDTIPSLQVNEEDVNVGHEATVGRIGEEQLFYLMSRGLSEQEAMLLIVSGFFKPFVKELPLEYAIEFNRLIQLEMEGAIA
jgi:Fe-S cluster assembly protein SufB